MEPRFFSTSASPQFPTFPLSSTARPSSQNASVGSAESWMHYRCRITRRALTQYRIQVLQVRHAPKLANGWQMLFAKRWRGVEEHQPLRTDGLVALPETGLSRGLFARCIARQRLPHIRVRNPELSSDLRWLEPRFEGCTNCIQLARCQSNGNLFDPPFL